MLRISLVLLCLFPSLLAASPRCATLFSQPSPLKQTPVFSRQTLSRPPIIPQETEYTCGPAVVRSFLLSKDIHYSEEYLADKMKTNDAVGTTGDNMVAFLQSLNFDTKLQLNLKISDLRELLSDGGSAILNVQLLGDHHWVLLVEISEDHVVLMDPWKAQSYRKISIRRLHKIWYGQEGRKAAVLIQQ